MFQSLSAEQKRFFFFYLVKSIKKNKSFQVAVQKEMTAEMLALSICSIFEIKSIES